MILFIIITLFSSNVFSKDLGKNLYATVSLGIAQESNQNESLYNPELSLSYHFKDLRISPEISLGLVSSFSSNYNQSEKGLISNYQTIGVNFLLWKKYNVRKNKIIKKNGKVYYYLYDQRKFKEGLYINTSFVRNSFFTAQQQEGYSLKLFYKMNKNWQVGLKRFDTTSSSMDISFNINSVFIGWSF